MGFGPLMIAMIIQLSAPGAKGTLRPETAARPCPHKVQHACDAMPGGGGVTENDRTTL
jgi:hypothetical protein